MTANVYSPSLPLVAEVMNKFTVFLLDYADPKIAKVSPTIEAGDVKFSRQVAGVLTNVANLTTVPVLVAGGTRMLEWQHFRKGDDMNIHIEIIRIKVIGMAHVKL